MNRFLLLLLLAPYWAFSQQNDRPTPWKAADLTEIGEKAGRRYIQPRAYLALELDVEAMRAALAQAPMERTARAKAETTLLELPMPDGSFARFDIYEAPIMARGLAERFPEIKTYAGVGLDDPTATVRLDLTPQGFHAMVFSARSGTVFIDPLFHLQTRFYQVYYKKNYIAPPNKMFVCGAHELATDHHAQASEHKRGNGQRFGDCTLRTYRLALACTGEYAQFHGGTVPLALAAMNTTMNRINGVYERDFAITMNIVPNNDLLVFTDLNTDPYDNNDNGAMLGQNQTTVDSIIGTANYDIGHVFGTGGGGVAGYAVVCAEGAKAIGMTGGGAPIGDPFDIDYVAHEIGHQFSGAHTFRGCGNTNPNDITAVEPGSGSTIMAYAGICGDNVQMNSDDYFHGYNLAEMLNFVVNGNGNTCGTLTPLNNDPPVIVTGPLQHTVPVNTPFFLTAQANDPDGNALTYCWEQFDTELSPQPPVANSTGGPNFRTIDPSPNPTRYFPNLQDLANGGPFTWEVLPTVGRTMHFTLSVRDNAAGGGCTDELDAVVAVDSASGPFIVTAPTAPGIQWTAQGQENVTWNVANTQFAPVSCPEVDILLSTDGGLTYPIVLASGVPNNGVYAVNVPNLVTATARIMVVCASNIFFDVSNNNFSIVNAPFGFTLNTLPNALNNCGVDTLSLALDVNAIGAFNGPVNLSISGLPAGIAAAFGQATINAGTSTTLLLSGLTAATPGTYTLTLTGNGNGGAQSAVIALVVAPAAPAPVSLWVPVDAAVNIGLLPELSWNAVPNADSYQFQLATDAAFTTILLDQSGIAGTSFQVNANLPEGTTLFWRVRAQNTCGNSPFGPARSFTTVSITCTTLVSTDVPVFITPNDSVTVYSTLNIPAIGILSDVNVASLVGTHDWMSDLAFTLISPTGTEVILMAGLCGDLDDFDILFDDQAAAPHGTIPCPPTNGSTYQPNEALAAFNGENPQGTWTLRIFDYFAADGGSLDDWSLEICYYPLPNAGCTVLANTTVNATGCDSCSQTASVSVTGATGGVAYIWSTGESAPTANNLCPGNYTVTVVDGGNCSATATAAVGPPATALLATATATPSQGNNGTATAGATGGTAPFSFLWNTGATAADIQQLAPGTYTVTVTDANGCTATASSIVINITGIDGIQGLQNFALLPNPTDGFFQALLSFDRPQEAVIDLYAPNGQLLHRSVHVGQTLGVPLDLKDAPNGVYLVLVRTAAGHVAQRVVLSR